MHDWLQRWGNPHQWTHDEPMLYVKMPSDKLHWYDGQELNVPIRLLTPAHEWDVHHEGGVVTAVVFKEIYTLGGVEVKRSVHVWKPKPVERATVVPGRIGGGPEDPTVYPELHPSHSFTLNTNQL